MKILIAEDNPDNLAMLSRRLLRAGFEVHSVGDGEAAVSAIQELAPDLVLMDVSMPKMSGLEATAVVRGLSGPVARTPIIALTAHAMEKDRQDALGAGCDDFATKPVDFAQLLIQINRFLPQSQHAAVGVP